MRDVCVPAGLELYPADPFLAAANDTPGREKIGHLTKYQIARLADATAADLCYTVNECRVLPGIL